MRRLTLKSAAELIADKKRTARMNDAAEMLQAKIEKATSQLAELRSLQGARNHLLARDHDTSEIDAAVQSFLATL